VATKKKTKKKATKRPAAKKKVAAKKTKKKATKKAATKKTASKSAKGATWASQAMKKTGPVPPKKPSLVTPKNKTTKQYTQSELYDCIQGYCGFTTRREAKEFYNQFATMVQSALKSGYRIPLPGLGKIQVRKTKARMGRNPMTQQTIMIPARKKVRFTPNKALKDAVL
jgi:DNA-binding protein HU-beta